MKKQRIIGGAAAVTAAIALAACGSSSSDSTTTTTASPTTTTKLSNFQVTTPDGQVSISLDGKLPPNWPASFPVPTGLTPAGSGSLGGKEQTAMVGVYTSSSAPTDTFNTLKSDSAYTTSGVSSIGVGDNYVGTFKLTAPQTGRITVVPRGSGSLVIVALNTEGTTNSTVGTTTTTVSSSSTTAAS